MSEAKTTSNAWPFLSAIAFMFLGLTCNPLFFVCSIFLFSATAARRNKSIGIAGAAFGLAFLLLLLGYGFGKDMALRDNSQSSVSHSGHAAA